MLDIENFELEKYNDEIQDDIGLLQYLYYDLKSDLDDHEMQNTYFGETFDDIKMLTEKVLKKYNAEGLLDMNVFTEDQLKDITGIDELKSYNKSLYDLKTENVKKENLIGII